MEPGLYLAIFVLLVNAFRYGSDAFEQGRRLSGRIFDLWGSAALIWAAWCVWEKI